MDNNGASSLVRSAFSLTNNNLVDACDFKNHRIQPFDKDGSSSVHLDATASLAESIKMRAG